MKRSKRYLVAVPAAVATLAVGVVIASAATSGGPVVKTPGSSTFKVNQFVKDSVHFSPGTITVASGGTATWEFTSGDPEPHTITVVTKKDLPKDFNKCKPCQIASKHLKNPKDQSSKLVHPVLNKGPAGLDEEGDSLALKPKKGTKVSAVVSAPAGTTLYYGCGIHPWMQGKIVVQ